MPRYIEADALREEINSLSVTLCGKELFGELAKHSVLQKIDEAPTVDVAPNSAWISVDERLPSEAERVLVYGENGICFANRYKDDWFMPMLYDGEITHWMPLPEPPKGERYARTQTK